MSPSPARQTSPAVGVAVIILTLLVGRAAGEDGLDLLAAGRAAREEAAAQLAATRRAIVDQRGDLTRRIEAAQRALAALRARDAIAASEARRLDQELVDNRSARAAEAAAMRACRQRLADAAAAGGLPARLERLDRDLRFSLADAEVLGRDGAPATVPVARLGAARAVALGASDHQRGFLAGDAAGTNASTRRLVAGVALAAADAALARPDAGTLLRVPVDIDGSLARGGGGANQGVAEWMRAGGLFMWPILITGLVGLLLVLERCWWLLRNRTADSAIDRVFENLLGAGAPAVATMISVPRTPLERLLRAGLDCLRLDRPGREAALEGVLLAEDTRLERGLSLLAVLAGVAPLLGLLGTVSGMIGMFATIAGAGTGNPRLLSGSISVALITTQFGLVVAVPLLVAHGVLGRAVERRQLQLERAANGFLGLPAAAP